MSKGSSSRSTATAEWKTVNSDSGYSKQILSEAGLTLRLQNELQSKPTDDGVRLTVIGDGWRKFEAEIDGPPATPYAGGKFKLELIVPSTYPGAPPDVKFLTPIWHPSTNPLTGLFYADFWEMRGGKTKNAAAMTLRAGLISLRSLLAAFKPKHSFDVVNAMVAKQHKEDPAAFEAAARHWTAVYARGPFLVREYEARVSRLVKIMEIDEHAARCALAAHNWNAEEAMTLNRCPKLLSGRTGVTTGDMDQDFHDYTVKYQEIMTSALTTSATVAVPGPRSPYLSEAGLTLRLQNELKDEPQLGLDADANAEADDGVRLAVVGDGWRTFEGEIDGPPDTPYEGGKFKLMIIVPDAYPLTPPEIKFLTRIWHPNANPLTGETHVCEWRSDRDGEWNATMTLRVALISLRFLLVEAEPEKSFDEVNKLVTQQYKEDPETFEATARHWTAVYAGGPILVEEYEARVSQLVKMGIDEHTGRYELAAHNWNIEEALNRCSKLVNSRMSGIQSEDSTSGNQEDMSPAASTPTPSRPTTPTSTDASAAVAVPVPSRSRTVFSEAELTTLLKRELQLPANVEGDDGVHLGMSWRTFEGEIEGPPCTPYEGGKFKVELTVPDQYPAVPPAVKFLTRIWHPNVNPLTGDTLVDFWGCHVQGKETLLVKDLRTLLISLRMMLANVDVGPEHCVDKKMAKQIQENPTMFEDTARYWTTIYAGGPILPVHDYEERVSEMVELGIDEHTGRYALAAHNWDLELAMEYALSFMPMPSPDTDAD